MSIFVGLCDFVGLSMRFHAIEIMSIIILKKASFFLSFSLS